MQVLTHRDDMTMTASERLALDSGMGQRARLEGALRLKGCRGAIAFTTPRIDGVPWIIATANR